MSVGYVHHDSPNTILLLPDANVTATLDNILRLIRNFVSPVGVAQIVSARDVARDWLPRHLPFCLTDRFRRRSTSDVRKIVSAVEANVAPRIRNECPCEPAFQCRGRIVAITLKQRLACNIEVNRLSRFLHLRIWRFPVCLWTTGLRMRNSEIDYKLPRTISLLLPNSYKMTITGRLLVFDIGLGFPWSSRESQIAR